MRIDVDANTMRYRRGRGRPLLYSPPSTLVLRCVCSQFHHGVSRRLLFLRGADRGALAGSPSVVSLRALGWELMLKGCNALFKSPRTKPFEMRTQNPS